MVNKARQIETEVSPPRLALKVLEFALPDHALDHVIGDLCEGFSEEVKSNSNPYKARHWFWRQTFIALLLVSLMGNLKILAAMLNICLFSIVCYLFLILTRFELSLPVSWLMPGVVFSLPFILLPGFNNTRILQDVFIYFSTHTHTLNPNSLARLSRFAGFAKNNCVWVAALFIAVSGARLLVSPESEGISQPFISVLGLELIILMHAVALHSAFSLLEQSGKTLSLR